MEARREVVVQATSASASIPTEAGRDRSGRARWTASVPTRPPRAVDRSTAGRSGPRRGLLVARAISRTADLHSSIIEASDCTSAYEGKALKVTAEEERMERISARRASATVRSGWTMRILAWSRGTPAHAGIARRGGIYSAGRTPTPIASTAASGRGMITLETMRLDTTGNNMICGASNVSHLANAAAGDAPQPACWNGGRPSCRATMSRDAI